MSLEENSNFLGDNTYLKIKDTFSHEIENLKQLNLLLGYCQVRLNGILIENLNSRVFEKLKYLKELTVFGNFIINAPNFKDYKLIINKYNIYEASKRAYCNCSYFF